MEDQLPALPPHGEEPAVARVQVRSVHRGAPLRQIPQASCCEMSVMRKPILSFVAVLAVVMAIGLVVPAAGQAPKKAPATSQAPAKFATPKTPWGDPDLQGVWNDATSTPLQRPAN